MNNDDYSDDEGPRPTGRRDMTWIKILKASGAIPKDKAGVATDINGDIILFTADGDEQRVSVQQSHQYSWFWEYLVHILNLTVVIENMGEFAVVVEAHFHSTEVTTDAAKILEMNSNSVQLPGSMVNNIRQDGITENRSAAGDTLRWMISDLVQRWRNRDQVSTLQKEIALRDANLELLLLTATTEPEFYQWMLNNEELPVFEEMTGAKPDFFRAEFILPRRRKFNEWDEDQKDLATAQQVARVASLAYVGSPNPRSDRAPRLPNTADDVRDRAASSPGVRITSVPINADPATQTDETAADATDDHDEGEEPEEDDEGDSPSTFN